MKVYQVSMYNPSEVGGEHTGYQYVSNKADALKIAKQNDEEIIDTYGLDGLIKEDTIELNKKSILSYLNRNCSHPDNG